MGGVQGRIIPIGPRILPLLVRYEEEGDLVFHSTIVGVDCLPTLLPSCSRRGNAVVRVWTTKISAKKYAGWQGEE